MEVHWEHIALGGGWPGCGFSCGGGSAEQQHAAAEAEAAALMHELECGLQDDGPDEVAAACDIITGNVSLAAFTVDAHAGCGSPAPAARTPEHSSCGGFSPRNSCDTTGAVLSPQEQQLWPHHHQQQQQQQLPGIGGGFLGMMVPLGPQYPCGSGTSGAGATTTTAIYPGCSGSSLLMPQLSMSGYMVPAGAAPLPTSYDAAGAGGPQLISSSSSSFLAGGAGAGPSPGMRVATTGALHRTPTAIDVPIASGGVAKRGSKKAPGSSASKRGDARARRSDGSSSKSVSAAATDLAAASDDDCKPRRGGRAAATGAAAAPSSSASKTEARSSGSAAGSANSQAALIRELQAEVRACGLGAA
jgi:hypothetical protein